MTQKQRTRLGNAVFYIGNTLVALIFVSPLIWMISSSLKPEAGIFKGLNSLRTFIPTGASLSNYLEVFQRIDMWKFICNSLFYVFVIVVLDLFINSICGYALAKFEFKGKNLLLTLVISLMVFLRRPLCFLCTGRWLTWDGSTSGQRLWFPLWQNVSASICSASFSWMCRMTF